MRGLKGLLDFIISQIRCRHVRKVRQMPWFLRWHKNLPMGFETLMHWFVSEVSMRVLPLRLCKGACFRVFAIRFNQITAASWHHFNRVKHWYSMQKLEDPPVLAKSLHCFTALYCIRPLDNFQLESCWKQAARQWSLGYADQPGFCRQAYPHMMLGDGYGARNLHLYRSLLYLCVVMCRHNFILKGTSPHS